jgi:hypothetical protein
MKIANRIEWWKKFAQQAGAAPTISLSQIPSFQASLFSVKPEFATDLLTIVNLINKHLFAMSGGKVSFSNTWISPSVGPSEYSNTVKNLYSLSKWIYGVISVIAPPYSLDGLKRIANDLIKSVNAFTFPEPTAAPIKSEIVNTCQNLLGKLGP